MLFHRNSTTALGALLISAFCGGCILDGSTHRELLSFDPTVEGLDVRTGSGNIVVERAADRSQIEVDALVHGSATELQTRVAGDVLYLDYDCPSLSRSCAVDWHVYLPEAATSLASLVVDTGSGDVVLRALDAPVSANTGSGDVELESIHGANFSVTTGSGDVELRACGTDSLEAATSSGNVAADLDRPPQDVDIETGSGDIDLVLPSARYNLAVSTGSGDIDLGGIDPDNQAQRRVELSTGSGNILVKAR